MDPADLVDRLTRRERELLSLLAEGLSNGGIGSRLFVSQKTVEALARDVFRKLELHESFAVNRRVSAALIYRDATLDRTPVPAYGDSFVGRDRLLDLLDTMNEIGVVILVGPGGIGKTRLAAEYASRIAVPGCRVYWADLCAVRSSSEVWPAVFGSFGVVAPSTAVGIRRLSRVLSGKNSLLVIDHAEPVLDDVREVVSTLRTMGLRRVLVTSRTPCRVVDEHVVELGPLGPVEARLLLDERIVDEVVAPNELVAAADGVPLAIELVAAHVGRVGPESLAGIRSLLDIDPGHRGLRSVLASSVHTLSVTERKAFGRLSLFPDGFSRDTATVVLGLPRSEVDVVLDGLVRLSLLGDSASRFRMLEPIRQHGLETLVALGGRSDAEQSMLSWAVEFARAATKGQSLMSERVDGQLTVESRNLATALDVAVAVGATEFSLRLFGHLGMFWAHTGPSEAFTRAVRVLSMADGFAVTDRYVARAFLAGGGVASVAGRDREAIAWLERSIGLCTSNGDRGVEAAARYVLGRTRRDLDELEHARSLADSVNEKALSLVIATIQAEVLIENGQLDQADVLLTELRGWPIDEASVKLASVNGMHALVLAVQGIRLDEAAKYVDDSIDGYRIAGNIWDQSVALGIASNIAQQRHRLKEAAAHSAAQLDLIKYLDVDEATAACVFTVAALAWKADLHVEATDLACQCRNSVARAHTGPRLRYLTFRNCPRLIEVAEAPPAAHTLDSTTSLVLKAREIIELLCKDKLQP